MVRYEIMKKANQINKRIDTRCGIFIIYLFFSDIYMKDKIKNYLNESATKEVSTAYNQFSFTKSKRRTLGSEEEKDQRNAWNTSVNNLSHFYSPPKSRTQFNDVQSLTQQNKRLKEEVKTLKQLLVDTSSISKTYDKIDISMKSKKDQKLEQVQKLKKIIQKSYFSIKEMESEISRLNQQLQTTMKNLSSLQKKYKILQFQKQELEHKLTNNLLIHKQQIHMCHQRIRKLDTLTEQLVEMIQQDQQHWSHHMHELNNLKKFYSSRTYK